jgi:hypothetical protein
MSPEVTTVNSTLFSGCSFAADLVGVEEGFGSVGESELTEVSNFGAELAQALSNKIGTTHRATHLLERNFITPQFN